MSNRMYEIQHGTAPRCQHIFDTNLQCKSPALRGHDFCYWHHQNRKFKPKFTVPLLETAHAIQLTLSRITADLYDGKIDTKRATALYYGLSLAMFNVRNLSNPVSSDHVIDLPPAISNVFDLQESADIQATVDSATALHVCHPERGRTPEPKDPDAAGITETADRHSDHRNADGLPNDVVTQQPAHAAWKSGASAPSCDPPQSGASAPVDASAPSAPSRPLRGTESAAPPKIPPASTFRPSITLPPEHFACPKPLDPSGPFLLREQRFTPDEIRAYWTQHLPPDVRDLRSTSGEFFYEGPEWLPLTPEEIEFLAANQAENRGAGTPEQNFWYERLVRHYSCPNIHPPKPQEILDSYERPDDGRSLAEILTSALAKQLA